MELPRYHSPVLVVLEKTTFLSMIRAFFDIREDNKDLFSAEQHKNPKSNYPCCRNTGGSKKHSNSAAKNDTNPKDRISG